MPTYDTTLYQYVSPNDAKIVQFVSEGSGEYPHKLLGKNQHFLRGQR